MGRRGSFRGSRGWVTAVTAVTAGAVTAVTAVTAGAVTAVTAGAAVAVAPVPAGGLLRLGRLDHDRAITHAEERAGGRDRHEIRDRAEIGLIERHVPGGSGRVRPEHLTRAVQAAAFQPVAAALPAHGVAGRGVRVEHRDV